MTCPKRTRLGTGRLLSPQWLKGAWNFGFPKGPTAFISRVVHASFTVVPCCKKSWSRSITVRHRKDRGVRGDTTVQPVTVHVPGHGPQNYRAAPSLCPPPDGAR